MEGCLLSLPLSGGCSCCQDAASSNNPPLKAFLFFIVVIRCLITNWLSAANSPARANILALRALSPQLMALLWPLVLACTSLHRHLAAPATPESHH
ncbi:TPA: hypothetical protein ACH3X3_007087 [Trebouxia sp. C0006]